ncbi:hypothetical protein PMAYCL1PPCAC_08857 [Pristionchus mayeri]|uniref:Uncharacterized protein n=1 Tax=Pristionchus mayeri TaxID=1317129 RepID=A0AAN4ZCH2_9BILA|nr:hypothetical protein PMAYCL1PPCAC_08857 [Pristionchus mayeri]
MMISKCCLRSVASMYSSTSCSSAAAAASTTRPRGTVEMPPSLLSSSPSGYWKGCRDQKSENVKINKEQRSTWTGWTMR